jgi:VWFA-related protein
LGIRKAFIVTTVFLHLFLLRSGSAQDTQSAQQSADIPVIHATSNLVTLDVTLLDDKERPVTKGLKQEDFTITEDKKPQAIFSFEGPDAHSVGADSENSEGKASTSIFVLDVLNETPEDVANYRHELDLYLKSLPAQLSAPAELLALGNESLELLQGYTRDRDELISALHRLPATAPYKLTMGSFGAERVVQSIDAIQQIVVQNQGVGGRKNIFWLGEGGPSVSPVFLTGDGIDKLRRYVHETANMLVSERITLFVYHPGLKPRGLSSGLVRGNYAGDGNPFSSDVNFGAIVNETGGTLYYNRNDIQGELGRSELKGSQFYTLSYQPKDGVEDGKFRRIRVSVKNSAYHILTKQGYFAVDQKMKEDPRRREIVSLGAAARATIPLTGIPMKISKIVRHPDTQAVEVSFLVPASKLQWQPGDAGSSRTTIRMAAVGFARSIHPVVWKVEDFGLKTGTADPQQLAKGIVPVSFTVVYPQKLQRMRILLEPGDQSQIGSIDLSRKEIDAAPEQPSATPTAATPKTSGTGAQ